MSKRQAAFTEPGPLPRPWASLDARRSSGLFCAVHERKFLETAGGMAAALARHPLGRAGDANPVTLPRLTNPT